MGQQLGCTDGRQDLKKEKLTPKGGPTLRDLQQGRDLNLDMAKKGEEVALEQPLLDVEEAGSVAETALDEEAEEGASVRKFMGNVVMSARCASFCTLLALFNMLPASYNYIALKTGTESYATNIGATVVTMIVFTIYANLGNTVQLAWQGAIGTGWACAFIFVMSAWVPGGASNPDYNPFVGHLINLVFIFLCLALNLNKNVRVFILSYHMYWVIDWMNPATLNAYNTSWSIFDNLSLDPLVTIVTACVGMVVALLAMFLPTPIKASSAAKSGAMSATMMVTELVGELSAYFSRSEPSVKIISLETKAVELREFVDSMQANVDAYWWENFDCCKDGLIRDLLGKHIVMMRSMCDNIFAMQVCIAKEDFGETHVGCMSAISDQVNNLCQAVKELLIKLTNSASDGAIDEDEEQALKDLAKAVSTALEALSIKFNETRKSICPEQVINTELQSESFYVYCLSVYARQAVDYTLQMLNNPPQPTFCLRAIWLAWVQVFDLAYLKKNLSSFSSFTWRNYISIVICYYLDFTYYKFSGACSGTASLLLTEFAGSAIQKNLGRLQGVILGKIVPQTIKQIEFQLAVALSMDIDGTTMITVRAITLWLWLFGTCYLYYASPAFGYIGCLAAAFGCPYLIYGPTNPEDVGGAAMEAANLAIYQNLAITCTTIIVMTLVDMYLAPERASTGAIKHYLKGLLAIDHWFQAAIMERKKKDGTVKAPLKCRADVADDNVFAKEAAMPSFGREKGVLLEVLNHAAYLGEEANKEPRYARAPWPMDFFNSLVRSAHVMRANLLCIEQVLQGSAGKRSKDIFASVRVEPQFAGLQTEVVTKMGDCISVVQAVLNNETKRNLKNLKEDMQNLEKAEKLVNMPGVFAALNKTMTYPEKTQPNLEDDEICRINVVLMLLDATVEQTMDMLKECLKMA